MRWVLMLFVVLAAVMGGEARAVVVTGRVAVSERVGKAEEKASEALRVESERAFLGAVLEVEEVAGFVDAGPLEFWFPGGSAVARSDCGDRQAVFSGGTSAAEYTETAAAGSAWTVPSAPTVQHVRGPDLGGGTKGLLYSLRRSLQPNEQSTWLPTFNRYNGRGDVVAQSDIDGTTTWAASYQADGRRTAEAGTNVERHRACTKEEDPTGLLNEGFRYRDLETGTFISRDPLGFVDGPNVYCYVGQNPWSAFDPEGLAVPRDRDQAQRHQDAILGAYDTAHEYMGRAIEVMSQGMRDGSRRTGEAWFEKAEFYYQAASYMSVELEVYERYRDAHGNCSDGVPNWWDPGCLGECTPEQIADTTYQARQTGAIGDSAIIQPTSLMETDMTFKFLDAGLTVSGVGAGVKALSAVSRKLFAGIGKAAAKSGGRAANPGALAALELKLTHLNSAERNFVFANPKNPETYIDYTRVGQDAIFVNMMKNAEGFSGVGSKMFGHIIENSKQLNRVSGVAAMDNLSALQKGGTIFETPFFKALQPHGFTNGRVNLTTDGLLMEVWR